MSATHPTNLSQDAIPHYARMIPGSPAPPSAYWAKGGEGTAAQRMVTTIRRETLNRNRPSRWLAHFLFPRPVTDPFALYQFVATDLVVLASTCTVLRFISPLWSLPRIQIPTYAVLVTLFGYTEGLYKANTQPLAGRNIVALVRSALFAAAMSFIAARAEMRAMGALITLFASLAVLLLCRLLKLFVQEHMPLDMRKRNVLIVGAGAVGQSIAQALRKEAAECAVVRGFLDDDRPLSPMILGRIDDLEWLARAEFVDEVILALPENTLRTRQIAAVALRNHLDIRSVPDLPPAFWPDAGVDHIGDVPVVTLHREPLPSATLFLKRLLDLGIAAFVLFIISPLLAAIALLVRLDSPGPALYAAERTGVKGRRFRCFKFRTMVTDSDRLKEALRKRNQREGPIFKIEDDPRITRIGRFLRRYSLDELPQLWNVLRGEMSLVGPRPHPIDDVNRYELHHFRRLDVKPGITGLWQVTARKSPSFDLGMYLDLTYIENWSLLLDLRILFQTTRVLFAPEGA